MRKYQHKQQIYLKLNIFSIEEMLNLIQNERHGNYNYTDNTSHLSDDKNAKV